MTEDYSSLLIRVVRGEESLSCAFWVSLMILALYFAYRYYIPSLSDVFQPYYHFFDVFMLTYALIAVHHSCNDSGLIIRLMARTYVLLLMMASCYIVYRHYGLPWAVGYPFIAIAVGFVLKE